MNCLDESNPDTHAPTPGIEHLIVLGTATPMQPPRDGWTPYGALMMTDPESEYRVWVYGRPANPPVQRAAPVVNLDWAAGVSPADLYAAFNPCAFEVSDGD